MGCKVSEVQILSPRSFSIGLCSTAIECTRGGTSEFHRHDEIPSPHSSHSLLTCGGSHLFVAVPSAAQPELALELIGIALENYMLKSILMALCTQTSASNLVSVSPCRIIHGVHQVDKEQRPTL